MIAKTGAIIIPDESVLNIPTFIKVGKGIYHAEIYREFSIYYFDELYDKFELLDRNFIILEIVDDMVAIWIPSQITEKQYEKLVQCEKILGQSSLIDIGISTDNDYNFISSNDFDNIKIFLEYFYKKLKEECLKKRGRK